MPAVTGAWSADELAAFLDRTTVPLRLACHTPADRLWLVALWFAYRDETFVCATARDATVVDYLEHDPMVAFEVSTNDPPYRGVRGNGTARVEPDDDLSTLRELIERYLGGTDSTLAGRLLDADREEVAIVLEPERLYSWDFTERMRDATGVE
jgi:hypothetical protein